MTQPDTNSGVDMPSQELLDLQANGWKTCRDPEGNQVWYKPEAFMKPCCYEDAIKLNTVINNWGKK